jgi:glycerophosphoryl diester phosphodiesterase
MLAAAAAATRLPLSPVSANPNTINQQISQHPFFAQAETLDVIAHRGGDGQWPGETMLAMRKSKELGADVLEMDVYLTEDNHLVLMHDNFVGSTTDVGGVKRLFPVHKFKLSELQVLNAAYRWSPGGSKTRPYNLKFKELTKSLQNDLRVPTLEEVFTTYPQTRMNIEMKWAPRVPSPAVALSRLIREHNMTNRVLVASFRHRFLREFRALSTEVATSASAWELIRYLGRNELPNAQAIQLTPEIAIEVLKLNLFKKELLTERVVEKAHNNKLPVHAWTINDLKEMSRIKGLGVDGIITDYPEPLLGLLGRTKPV